MVREQGIKPSNLVEMETCAKFQVINILSVSDDLICEAYLVPQVADSSKKKFSRNIGILDAFIGLWGDHVKFPLVVY